MNRRHFLDLLKERREKKRTQDSSLDLLVLEKEKLTKKDFSIPMRPPLLSGLDPYTGSWGVKEISHLLRRTMFGAKYEDVKYFRTKTMNQAVNELLSNPDLPIDLPINDYGVGNDEDPDIAFGETFIGAEYLNEREGLRIWSLKGWWLRRMMNQERSIKEKMLLFWHNHIPVQMSDVFHSNWNYEYLEVLRNHSMGNFRDLVKDVTLNKAMLFYLNGQFNSKEEPDENYSRELQELFCIGKGPNAKFTEEDVQAMARILTGWRMNWTTEIVRFHAWDHDTGDKQLSEFYNNAIIEGRSGNEGEEELDELFDVIFDNNEVALFVCRKLYRFFVYHAIDAQAEAEVIAPLAEIYRNNDYNIEPVLNKLFKSQHFYDAANRGAMLKSAVDYQVSLYREFNVELPPEDELYERFDTCGTINYFLNLLQQSIGDPPNVSGWPAYYQIPNYDKHWVTTDTLPKRLQITDLMLIEGISSDNYSFPLDVIKTVSQLPDPSDPNKLIDNTIEWLYGIEVSNGVKLILKSILLSGQLTDSYWTVAWFEYENDPDDPMKMETVRTRLIKFFYYLVHLEEFQLS